LGQGIKRGFQKAALLYISLMVSIILNQAFVVNEAGAASVTAAKSFGQAFSKA
jgi:hypothetical protein